MTELPIRESELLRRFRAGDRDAFTLLYRAHQAGVFRFAMLMTGDRARATEGTQDVFICLIDHTGNYDPAPGQVERVPRWRDAKVFAAAAR
jgi:DNA-directed RNA polymerase specialized sigma24 family protein